MLLKKIQDHNTKTSRPSRAERKKQKKQRKRRQAEALPVQRFFRGGLLPAVSTKLHADFSKPTTPFHRLFQTDDDGLFYFDGRHLGRVSTFMRDLLDLPLTGSPVTLGSSSDLVNTDTAIPLHFAAKLGIALLFHVLLFETHPYPVLPKSVVENDFLSGLINAQECVDRMEIGWYDQVIQQHIIPTAETLKTTQPFQALALAVLASHQKLIKEITWLTLAHPIEDMSTEIVRLLEDRAPDLLDRLHHLHSVVKPATVRLRDALLRDPVLDLVELRVTDLPDCRRFACAITTGYDYEKDEISTTRRLAADKIMEGLFQDDTVKPRINTIVGRLNTCEVCNLKLAVLLRGLVLEFECKYKRLC